MLLYLKKGKSQVKFPRVIEFYSAAEVDVPVLSGEPSAPGEVCFDNLCPNLAVLFDGVNKDGVLRNGSSGLEN